MTYCQSCGAEARTTFQFCPACGGRQFGSSRPSGPAQSAHGHAGYAPAPAMPSGLPASGLSTVPVAVQRSIDVSAMQYAGFWRRTGAFCLDQLIMTLVFSVPIIFIVSPSTVEDFMVFNLIGLVFAWLYYAVQESGQHQGTFGKRALGLVVADMQGQRLSFARATGHHFARLPSSMLLLVGYFMLLFTERRQTLHDKLAGAVVLSRGV